ncbi:hypothetical protein FQN53_006752 [Emmonsiellopsis sp. PD_33]|nr:hypothetical protein FQN53_006752 [Emmonsiellopsis sp. PD_33]
MHFLTSLALPTLLGLSTLILPTLALTAPEADKLYGVLMHQPEAERYQILSTLDAPSKTQLLISRIHAYQATHALKDEQSDFLAEVIEHITQANEIPPALRAEGERFFDFETFKLLTTTLDDFEAPRLGLEARMEDCNCAAGDCGSGRYCDGSDRSTCVFQINKCGHWWNRNHCVGLCRKKK